MKHKLIPSISVPADRVAYHFLDENLFSAFTDELVLAACRDSSSNFAANVARAVSSHDYNLLMQVKMGPPELYPDGITYLRDAQILALVKKYPFWQTSHNPTVEAYKAFIAAEIKCHQTNNRLLSDDRFTASSAVHGIMLLAQKKIASILGPLPAVSDLDFQFGPGAAYSVKKNTSPLDKLAATLDVTAESVDDAQEYLRSCPGWRPNDLFDPEQETLGVQPLLSLTTVVGDRITTVPKTALTDRTIAIGPLVNVLMQKGYGGVIRERMKKCNNLNKNESLHKTRARSASVAGDLATVDLKAASDTIAFALVLQLLPFDWFDALDRVRSHRYEIEGKVYTYSKFSAMGNGFTFELESLIFYALAFSTAEFLNLETSRISTFGDDIIIPTPAYTLLKEVLEYCGFTLNSEKSYCAGPFRESCGGDFFLGMPVRPFYLKDKLTYRTLFLLHNFLVRTGHQFIHCNLYRFVRKLLGKQVIRWYKSSDSYSDGVLYDPSAPTAGFYYVELRLKGCRKDSFKKGRWGIAAILYRNLNSKRVTESDIEWRTTKTPTTRLKAKMRYYRHF